MKTGNDKLALKLLTYISLAILTIFLIVKLKVVIGYVLIACVLALVLRPIVKFLNDKLKLNSTLSSIFALLILSSVIAGLISLLIPLVLEQGRNLSLLNINSLNIKLNILFSELNEYLTSFNISLSESILNFENLTKNSVEIIPSILNWIGSVLGSITIGILSVLFISFFLLKDGIYFEDNVVLLFPKKLKTKIKKSIETIKGLLSRYFIGLILQVSILFIIYTLTLLIFGIKDAIVIALICAILNLIPYVGPLIGIFLMIFLSMTSNLGQDFSDVIAPTSFYIFIFYLIAQLIDNFFSQPYIFSNSVKSHPLEIFIVIISGGLLFGIGGMILAIPTYTSFKVIGKVFFNKNDLVKKLTKNI
tara:strand:+ start:2471 stop:3556 length:1086 start_codon:yes stop_codon:yes gene_type:complete